jgi:hypothetical protein
MKRFLTVVFTMLLAGSLAFAQDTGGDKAKTGPKTSQLPQPQPDAHKSHKKGHKGEKKGKKGSSSSTGNTTPK